MRQNVLYILIILLCGSVCLSLSAQPSSDFNGHVAQSVVHFSLPDGSGALAVVFAYSDNLAVYKTGVRTSREISLWKTYDVGAYPGPANDLPRDIVALDANLDGMTDLVVLCSGNPNTGTKGHVQIFEARPDGTLIPHKPVPAEPEDTSLTGLLPISLSAGRLDRDPFSDLVVGYGFHPSIGIIRGGELSEFQWLTQMNLPNAQQSIPAVALSDIDGDGVNDITAAGGNKVFIINGRLSPWLQPVIINLRAGSKASSIDITDLDQDTVTDIVVGDSSGYVHVLKNISFNATQMIPPVILPAFGESKSGGVSDVKALDWDMDCIPEIAAVNRLDNCISILKPVSGENPDLYSTDNFPRRMDVGDLDGDGKPDMISANEGDLNVPDNPDISVIFNHHKIKDQISLRLQKKVNLAGKFPNSIGFPSAACIYNNSSYLVADAEKNRLCIVSEGGAVTPLPSSSFHNWKDVSGLAVHNHSSATSFFAVERGKNRILEMNFSGIIKTTSIKEEIPGGVSGLVYDSTHDEFWLFAPLKKELLIISSDGSVKWRHSMPKAYTALDVDFRNMTIYAGGSGCLRIDRFIKRDNNLVQKQFIDLMQIFPYVFERGVSAMSLNMNGSRLFMFTPGRTMTGIDPTGPGWLVDLPRGLSHGRGVVSMTLSISRDRIFALDLDGAPSILQIDTDGDVEAIIPLIFHLRDNPFFKPAAITVNRLPGEENSLLVADSQNLLFAKVDTGSPSTGSEFGWYEMPIDSDFGSPITGFDMTDNSGSMIIRTRRGLAWLRNGNWHQISGVDATDPGDISVSEHHVYSCAPTGRRLRKVRTDLLTSSGAFLGAFLGSNHPAGIAFSKESRTLYMSTRESGEMLIFLEEKINAASPAWSRYE